MKSFIILITVVTFCCASAAQTFVGVSSEPGQVVGIDLQSQTSTATGHLNYMFTNSMAKGPRGRLYTVGCLPPPIHGYLRFFLLEIDAATAETRVLTEVTGAAYQGLAIDEAGRFYVIIRHSEFLPDNTSHLARLDPDTGLIDVIGSTGLNFLDSLELGPDGRLWSFSYEKGLVILDPETASVTDLFPGDDGQGLSVNSIVFDDAGRLYAFGLYNLGSQEVRRIGPDGILGEVLISLPDHGTYGIQGAALVDEMPAKPDYHIEIAHGPFHQLRFYVYGATPQAESLYLFGPTLARPPVAAGGEGQGGIVDPRLTVWGWQPANDSGVALAPAVPELQLSAGDTLWVQAVELRTWQITEAQAFTVPSFP
jgi:hypothetical protein